MKWSEFNKDCQMHFSNTGSTWYHKEVELRGAKVITFIAYKIGISPNLLTLASTLFAVGGMVIILLFPHDWRIGIINALLLQLCFILDCSDGVLARLRNKKSKFGAFLDIFLDRFNNFIVFGGFGFAWFMNSQPKPPLIAIAIYISASSAYILYTIASMQRGFIFSDLSGIMQKFGQSWREKIMKFPYQFMNMGVHFLFLSIAYIFGFIFYMVVFYGVLSFVMIIVMIIYLYIHDKQSAG